MGQQILVIHGGNTFQSYDTYLASLRSEEISLKKLMKKSWKDRLSEDLGTGYEVIAPKMPNAQNARYEEWKIRFEKILPLLNEDIILLGHSLGGIFLAKYLSEHLLLKKIKAVFLIAAPFGGKSDPDLQEFAPSRPLKNLEKQAGRIVLYHSKDDPVVPFDELEKYRKELPSAEVRVFEDKGHFNQESFPEILKDIQSI